MSTLAILKSSARLIGASVTREREGMSIVCRCTAPPGMRWLEGGVHEFVDEVFTGPNDYADILSRMRHGMEPCPERPHCDWCDEETDQ